MQLTFGSERAELAENDGLVGQRVRIQAIRDIGSARVLNHLLATVIARHPIAPLWYKIHLDPNSVTRHHEWTIPADRLVVLKGGSNLHGHQDEQQIQETENCRSENNAGHTAS
jgi:hypothetical protein